MTSQISVYDSFSQRLPDFPRFGPQEDGQSTHVSGSSTAASTPPRCGVNIPVDHWTNLASRICLDSHEAILRNIHLPKAETLIGFKSEADVVNASTLTIMNPVHLAYELVYPNDISLSEVTRPSQDGTASARVDRANFKGRPSNLAKPGRSNNIFALLEYKKFGIIPRDDFERGIANTFDRFSSIIHIPLFIDETDGADSNDIPIILLKQATHYAARYRTPFVALCDYKTLILLVLTEVEGLDAGQYAYMTVVKNSAQIRKAYLGFLLAARLYSDQDTRWRQDASKTDIFQRAEDWDRQLSSANPQTNPPRDSRNNNPVHDSPGSNKSDASMTGMQRGAGKGNQPTIARQSRALPNNGANGARMTAGLTRDSSQSSTTSSSSSRSVSTTATTVSRSSSPGGSVESGSKRTAVTTTTTAAARRPAINTTGGNIAQGVLVNTAAKPAKAANATGEISKNTVAAYTTHGAATTQLASRTKESKTSQ